MFRLPACRRERSEWRGFELCMSFSFSVASSSLRNYFVPDPTRDVLPTMSGDCVSGMGSKGINLFRLCPLLILVVALFNVYY